MDAYKAGPENKRHSVMDDSLLTRTCLQSNSQHKTRNNKITSVSNCSELRRRVGERRFRRNFNKVETSLSNQQYPAKASLKKRIGNNLPGVVHNNHSLKEYDRLASEAMKRARFGYRKSVALHNETRFSHLKTIITDRRNNSISPFQPILIHKKQSSIPHDKFPIKPSHKNNSIDAFIIRQLQELASDRTFDTEQKLNAKLNNSQAVSLKSKFSGRQCKLMAKRLSLMKEKMAKLRESNPNKQFPLISISSKTINKHNRSSLIKNTKAMNLAKVREEGKSKLLARLRKIFNVEKDTRMVLIPTLRIAAPIVRLAIHDVKFQITEFIL